MFYVKKGFFGVILRIFAQLCLKRPENLSNEGASDEMVQTAISTVCRELSHLACMGAPIFSKIARNDLQYSVESVDSFHKYVYDEVVEGKANKSPDQAMTKAQARKTLSIGEDATKADIDEVVARYHDVGVRHFILNFLFRIVSQHKS